MATLTEQLFQENISFFELAKPKLTEQVMNDIRKYGHHRIFFHCKQDVALVRLERYPDGSDCTQIHNMLVRHAEKYLREQGFHVAVQTWDCNNAPRCIDVSL